jgi:hypothetical protein
MRTPKKFAGKWRIAETELWEKEALDLVVPAHMTFEPDGLGHFQMIAVEGGLDCRFDGNRVEFSWIGDDEGDPTSGRGWAEMTDQGTLEGRIYFHQGDDSAFTARRSRAK